MFFVLNIGLGFILGFGKFFLFGFMLLGLFLGKFYI